QEYGITNVRPRPEQELIFFGHDDLDQLTYQFTGDYESAFLENHDLSDSMLKELKRWSALWEQASRRPMLRIFTVEGETKAIHDTRTCAVEAVYLPSPGELELLEFCERPRTRSDIPSRLLGSLSLLVERHYILDYEDALITLVTNLAIGVRLRSSLCHGSAH
ncbi:MAG: hypothetical protein MI702_12260, partial [Chlorobiales bacterium]|nr:hypothetical protein [Chlorobiales bacterium]